MASCSSSAETKTSPGCGCGEAIAFDGASTAYKRVLGIVIAINVLGFAVVGIGSWVANSASLAANTLDFAADAATYALSLWAIGRSVTTRSNAALIKGASLGAMAVSILAFAAWRAITAAEPDGDAISGLGLFGAAANLVAAALLVRFRDGDANVRSVWICTRNDLIQCLAVAITGAAVAVTHSRWPDLIVGAVLAAVFLRSSWQIISQAQRERRATQVDATQREYITHSIQPRRRV